MFSFEYCMVRIVLHFHACLFNSLLMGFDLLNAIIIYYIIIIICWLLSTFCAFKISSSGGNFKFSCFHILKIYENSPIIHHSIMQYHTLIWQNEHLGDLKFFSRSKKKLCIIKQAKPKLFFTRQQFLWIVICFRCWMSLKWLLLRINGSSWILFSAAIWRTSYVLKCSWNVAFLVFFVLFWNKQNVLFVYVGEFKW